MGEKASSNITQILASFETFLKIYQDPSWTKQCTPETIKFAFKTGHFLEKCIDKFRDKQYLPEFMKLLELWCHKNNLKSYNQDFFKNANEQILLKVFRTSGVNENTLDIAIRIFCSIYDKPRLKEFLSQLILTSSSINAITDFVNISMSENSDLKHVILLNKWNDLLNVGQEEALKSEIDNWLSLYKVEERLPNILCMLCAKIPSNQLDTIKNLIMDSLLSKMGDRSILSKNFWITLFKRTDKGNIAKLSSIYKPFLDSLWSFIEYTGSMFQRDTIHSFEWKSDPILSIYPEIDYFDLFNVLKAICSFSSTNTQYIFAKLEQAKDNSNEDLWIEMENELNSL
ncbi:ubiquitin-fold modifier 1 isoform X1 [Rhynchophorus ferrugineus]|uniref:ubiquitin-fold modifier 1 isoform X1 n=1 Tax=Rhynchophorus ferrugineus TaxID=354439 RepID=UPI003FCCD4A1